MNKVFYLGLFCLFSTSLLSSCEVTKYFVVNFDTGDGTYIAAQKVEENKTATKPANPTRDGYTFDNWYLGDNAYNFDTKVTNDITITARWKKDTVKYKFEFIGSNCSLNNKTEYAENQEVNLSFTVQNDYNLPDTIHVIGVNSYQYSKANKTLSLKVTNNITVICDAIHKDMTYKINFYIDGTIQPTLEEDVRYNNFVQRPETPTRKGFVFDGWYTNSGCTGSKYGFNTGVTSSFSLYGKFNSDEDVYYDITFSASDAGGYFNNDPTCTSLTYSYKYGTTINNAPIPYKPQDDINSYSFNGWTLTTVVEAKTYKAAFTPQTNAYTIRWLNYDLTELKTECVTRGDLPVYDKEKPSRKTDFEGSYTFTGWSPNISPAFMDMIYVAQYDMTSINSLYPQTLETNASVIEELNKISTVDEKGYKTYDGSKYYQFTSADTFVSDDGTLVNEGETNYYRVEPIKWITLEINPINKKRLVMSEKLLDSTKYQETYQGKKTQTDYQGNTGSAYSNNYKYSIFRTYLNVDFLNRAFVDSTVIPVTEVDNSSSTTRNIMDNPFACENTNDKIFGLSYQDMKNISYFPTDDSRKAEKTDFARAKRTFPNIPQDDYIKYGQYATRSPRSWEGYTDSFDSITEDGVFTTKTGTTASRYGIRPAIFANL